jgi:sporulation protein YlmC with PRC-barrel domain
VERGERISYMALEEGTPVLTSEGREIGRVKRVLASFDDDIFDGLIVSGPEGDRFVDADNVADILERAVVLTLSDEEAGHLPEATPGPPVLEVAPEDVVKRPAAEELGRSIRAVWERIRGKY